MGTAPTDYEADLLAIDQELAELGDDDRFALAPVARQTRFVYLHYRRASLTGEDDEAAFTADAVADAIGRYGTRPDLCLVEATIAFNRHRLADSRRSVESCSILAGTPQGRTLLADIDYHEGRYDQARSGYERCVREDRTWEALVRLAYVRSRMGDPEGAEELYLEAEDEITAKEMRSYAWVELQRGLLQLAHGCYDQAGHHYALAMRAYSGDWRAQEYLAELLAARGDVTEALSIYHALLTRTHRPDLQQALGDLYQLCGETQGAQEWHEKALAGYSAAVDRGEVHYFHHLAGFYGDVGHDGGQAVRWARKDLALRPNYSTQASLAWALYQDGQLPEADDLMGRALSSGVVDARYFARAARISAAVGRTDEAGRLLRRAAETNPHHDDFCVRR